MKITTLFFTFILFATTGIYAQSIQRKSISERVKTTMNKITAPLKLDASQASRTDSVFTEYYNAQHKMMTDARAAGTRPGRSDFEKIMNDRDEKLKVIFTESQYTKFKNEVEDSLRPQWQSHEGN